MADEQLLKSVRIVQPDPTASQRELEEGTRYPSDTIGRIRNSETSARLDVYQKGKRKYAVLKSPNTYFPDIGDDYKFEKVDRSMSDDDVIKGALFLLRNQASNIGYRYFSTFSISDNLVENKMILQNPWKDSPPTSRNYGFTYYYLNDGSQINIEWLEGSFSKGSKYDNASGYIEKLVRYSPYTKSHGTEGLPADLRDQSDAATEKFARSRYQGKDGKIGLNIDYSDVLRHSGTSRDSDIIESVIENLKSQITSFDGTSESKLALCDPDTEYCKLIRYVDFNGDPKPTTTDDSALKDIPAGSSQSSDKTKLFLVGLPDKIEIKVGENLPDFSVHVNKIYTPPEENINNSEIDEFSDLEELDEEYTEAGYAGEAETGLVLTEWKLQDSISSGQEDSVNSVGVVGPAVDIKPVSSFDALINLAGKCARELGKNARVNAENMKKSYTKGIHGLCPQGTQAVLYALTGVKAVGQISGNADWFSFGPTNPSGGDNKGSFSKSGYFKDKEKIRQIGGSWKGTYLHKDSKNMWQVGDVIAMAYSGGKSYGHIQVWTGYSWMSDFKQGNSIQQNHVNVDSVALWRLSDKGLASIKTQNSNLS